MMGITPAYAGNTGIIVPVKMDCKDHPRLRGEHKENIRQKPKALGSPPPTRGTLGVILIHITRNGITPAYAGNTHSLSLRLQNLQDHPRLRGEHSSSQLKALSIVGSPPPTRGTHPMNRTILLWTGITPAYAGNTRTRYEAKNDDQDHPRLRGEHD